MVQLNFEEKYGTKLRTVFFGMLWYGSTVLFSLNRSVLLQEV